MEHDPDRLLERLRADNTGGDVHLIPRLPVVANGDSRLMAEPHAQDEGTFDGHDDSDSVLPPAPSNQSTSHDGGIEPASPAPSSAKRALRRIGRVLGEVVKD